MALRPRVLWDNNDDRDVVLLALFAVETLETRNNSRPVTVVATA